MQGRCPCSNAKCAFSCGGGSDASGCAHHLPRHRLSPSRSIPQFGGCCGLCRMQRRGDLLHPLRRPARSSARISRTIACRRANGRMLTTRLGSQPGHMAATAFDWRQQRARIQQSPPWQHCAPNLPPARAAPLKSSSARKKQQTRRRIVGGAIETHRIAERFPEALERVFERVPLQRT